MDVIDQQIVRLYIVRRLPQLDAAGEIGIDRKTISRRLPHIYNTARRLQQQENQRLRDELAQSRAANNDYMQSQYILGQLGRYYQNPPCNPCGCGG